VATDHWSGKLPKDMTFEELAAANTKITGAYEECQRRLNNLASIQNHLRSEVGQRNGFSVPGLPSPGNLPAYPVEMAVELFGQEED
jgi:hypothetical protein